ncbi:DUF1127 domain-containing protein [Arvimicrobium flavum]|uniref:DUF1127 domain-containing protein n=1 Tax=Arvimicrobium flavum TaxID=3393320 RepID=UPI00237A6B37|nr:DUF1127 domain-containing protein [Mesorhizobium shangrilense]
MMTIETIPQRQSATNGNSVLRRGAIAIMSCVNAMARMMERRRTRLALLELTDYQLKDIGVSRSDAHREGVRRIWD